MVPFLLTTKIASISPSFSKKNSLFIFFFLFLLHLHFRFCFLLLTIPPKIHLRPSAAAIVIRFVFLNVIVVLIKQTMIQLYHYPPSKKNEQKQQYQSERKEQKTSPVYLRQTTNFFVEIRQIQNYRILSGLSKIKLYISVSRQLEIQYFQSLSIAKSSTQTLERFV